MQVNGWMSGGAVLRVHQCVSKCERVRGYVLGC